MRNKLFNLADATYITRLFTNINKFLLTQNMSINILTNFYQIFTSFIKFL